MVAVDLMGGEDHQVGRLLLGVAHDRLRPLAEEDLVVDAHPLLLERLLQGEQLGRRPGLQPAVEVGHLLEIDVLDGLDDVQQVDLAARAGDLHGAVERRLVLLGKVHRNQDLSEHVASPLAGP